MFLCLFEDISQVTSMKSFGTGIPWNDIMHHNMVLMWDTHADLAVVLEDARSVNPYMHH